MSCELCSHYEFMMKIDPHFAPQYLHSWVQHRLYGVCVRREEGLPGHARNAS